MKVTLFGIYTDCPLEDKQCIKPCDGRCERLMLYEEKIREEASEVLAGMRENGTWDGDDDEDVNYNEKYDD